MGDTLYYVLISVIGALLIGLLFLAFKRKTFTKTIVWGMIVFGAIGLVLTIIRFGLWGVVWGG